MQEQNKRFMDPNIPDEMASTIRPKTLGDFIGHDSLKQNLSVFVSAARNRGEAMDHVLLYGPPGLGKTTLAHIIANELGTNFRATSAPMVDSSTALAKSMMPSWYNFSMLIVFSMVVPSSSMDFCAGLRISTQ